MKFAVTTSSLAALCRIRNSRIACAGGGGSGERRERCPGSANPYRPRFSSRRSCLLACSFSCAEAWASREFILRKETSAGTHGTSSRVGCAADQACVRCEAAGAALTDILALAHLLGPHFGADLRLAVQLVVKGQPARLLLLLLLLLHLLRRLCQTVSASLSKHLVDLQLLPLPLVVLRLYQTNTALGQLLLQRVGHSDAEASRAEP